MYSQNNVGTLDKEIFSNLKKHVENDLLKNRVFSNVLFQSLTKNV